MLSAVALRRPWRFTLSAEPAAIEIPGEYVNAGYFRMLGLKPTIGRTFTPSEDIASETFARAWTAPGEIRVGTVKAYLFMIARNLSLDLRRAAREVVECGPDVVASGASPEQATIDRDALREVLAGLAELPEADRAALLMRAVGQLSYEETAAALGVSVGAARVRVHRARARLATSASRRRTQP